MAVKLWLGFSDSSDEIDDFALSAQADRECGFDGSERKDGNCNGTLPFCYTVSRFMDIDGGVI